MVYREEKRLRRTNLFRAFVCVTDAKLETCISGRTFLNGRIGIAVVCYLLASTLN